MAGFFGAYTGAEEYQQAFIGAKVEILRTTRGAFSARAFRAELDGLWVAGAEESAPRIKHSMQRPERAFVTFLTEAGPEAYARGIPIPQYGLVRHPQGHSYHERTTGATRWGVISLPIEDMALMGTAAAGHELAPPSDMVMVPAGQCGLAPLLGLHAAIRELAEKAPDVLACPEVAHSLQQSLLAALVTCHFGHERVDGRNASWRHQIVMRRFRRILEENPDRPLYIPEVCKEVGVPDRTLRTCCQEELGMSPKQFLAFRRIHMARRALRAAEPGTTTVTEIATQFGFWHFGRFAGSYGSLFGESPVATLRQSSLEDKLVSSGSTGPSKRVRRS